MGFIAEFTITSPLMRETAQAMPNMTFEMEDVQVVEDGPARFVFWATGDGFDRLHNALAADSTVAEFSFLTDFGSRRLYRASFTEEGKRQLTYPVAAEYDIVYLDLTATHEGSYIRAQVPTREALGAYRDACRERDIPFHLERLYHEGAPDAPERYGLTRPQSEALRLAYERGYFASDRKVTLEELSEEFGISRQALAGRLRRGHERLIENTIA